ncbi:hypothetical protein OH76DRAFT_779661 [Lentinus brumalis]|uniref:Uncharacterized protein n=1 Tax=Lentinus brumalis TaxID=2498619 RepID=A0A371D4G7_9APHY|nr:hypothetical protein OH76DRAFT_779661 [Polyporus brumalis]
MLLVVETPIASANDIQQLRALGMASRARHSRFTDLERKTSSTSTAGAPTSGQAFAGFSEESGSLIGNITATDVAPDEFTPPTNRPSLRPTDSLSHATPEHAVRKPSASATSTAPFRIHAGRSYKRPTPVATHGMPWAAHAARMLSVGCRMQITPERVMQFQEELEDIDNASLIQLEPQHDVYQSANGQSCRGK